ncbi:MAG: hypothetical protein CM1200mP9_05900 [Gammaproteobacteria bacterium]|nr:MAG: hypothetical protein CM1200mP9_05900 [Gammaproteobacteria bacterium]
MTNWQSASKLLNPDTTILIPEGEARWGSVFSHLFRSIVLSRPTGPRNDCHRIRGRWGSAESLLTYLVSYREYAGFHEHVVERIYRDLMEVASFTKLSVEGHFLRRGGFDINPFRATHPRTRPFSRARVSEGAVFDSLKFGPHDQKVERMVEAQIL